MKTERQQEHKTPARGRMWEERVTPWSLVLVRESQEAPGLPSPARKELLLKSSVVPLAPDGPRVKGVPSFSG